MKGYSAPEVAQLLGVPVRRVYSYVRSGFLEPERDRGRRLRFSFQDLVVLRAAKGLMQAQISPARVRRILKKLVADLPEGRSLAGLTIVAEGNRIVARSGGRQWNPESGQRIFDFEVSDLARRVEPIVRRQAKKARESASEATAEDWYEMGLHLEVGAPEDACDAYRRALALDAQHVDAHVNLGRLEHERGRLAEAEEHYRTALAADPESDTAAFNLGVVLEDLGRIDEAVFVYERLVKRDAENADAHFNLARLYERTGKSIAALRHTRAYERLV